MHYLISLLVGIATSYAVKLSVVLPLAKPALPPDFFPVPIDWLIEHKKKEKGPPYQK